VKANNVLGDDLEDESGTKASFPKKSRSNNKDRTFDVIINEDPFANEPISGNYLDIGRLPLCISLSKVNSFFHSS